MGFFQCGFSSFLIGNVHAVAMRHGQWIRGQDYLASRDLVEPLKVTSKQTAAKFTDFPTICGQ